MDDWTDEQVKAMAHIARAIAATMRAVTDRTPRCAESQAAIGKLAEALILCEAAMGTAGKY